MKINLLFSIICLVFQEMICQDLRTIFTCDDSSTATTNLRIGDEVTLCIHIYERSKRMAFRINVDKYSVLTMVGEYLYAVQDTTNRNHSFVAQIGKNMTAFNSLFFFRDNYYVPLLNIIIKITNGVINDIVWQNDCFTCPNTVNCVTNNRSALYGNTSYIFSEKNCMTYLNQCNVNDKNFAFSCDPKIYVTWFGTDAKGKPMSSSNLSFEKFRQYSIGSLYSSAVGVFNNTLNQVVGMYDNVKNQVNSLVNTTRSLLL